MNQITFNELIELFIKARAAELIWKELHDKTSVILDEFDQTKKSIRYLQDEISRKKQAVCSLEENSTSLLNDPENQQTLNDSLESLFL